MKFEPWPAGAGVEGVGVEGVIGRGLALFVAGAALNTAGATESGAGAGASPSK